MDELRGGATLSESVADVDGVSPRALKKWRLSHPDFECQVVAAQAESGDGADHGGTRLCDRAETQVTVLGVMPGYSTAPRTDEEARARLHDLMWAAAENPSHPSHTLSWKLLFKKLEEPDIAARIAQRVRVAQAEPVALAQPVPKPMTFVSIPANGSEAPGRGPAEVIDIEPEKDAG